MKTLKKLIFVTLALSIILSAQPFSVFAESEDSDEVTVGQDEAGNVIIIESGTDLGGKISLAAMAAKEKRIVISKYTLTKKQTKKLAQSMKSVTTNAEFQAALALISGWWTSYGPVVAAATSLAAKGQISKTVVKAAKQGKRVKVTLTDGTYHTSYSYRVSYKIVK